MRTPLSFLLSLFLLVLLSSCAVVRSWKKDEFRNCNQTPFYKRARARKPGSSPFLATDVSISDGDQEPPARPLALALISEEEHDRGSGGDSAARPHQELSAVFGYSRNLYPLDTIESCVQAGDPGQPLGSAPAEQAMEEHSSGRQNAVQRFDVPPDVFQVWQLGRFFDDQEAHPHCHDTRQHLDFDDVKRCYCSTPRSHVCHNHAGCSSGMPPASMQNWGHSLLSNGGPEESSSRQRFSDAREMSSQCLIDKEKLIQMPQDLERSFVSSNPTWEFSDPVADGQDGDGATDTGKRGSSETAPKVQDREKAAEPSSATPGGKRAENATENGGFKRCDCRTFKCLQLNCECFAAELFCTDSCACRLCYNIYEMEDSVFQAKERIQSRNPNAFPPRRVVQSPGRSRSISPRSIPAPKPDSPARPPPDDKPEGGSSQA